MYRVVVDLFVAGIFFSVCLLVESCRVLEILINLMEVLECVSMYIWALSQCIFARSISGFYSLFYYILDDLLGSFSNVTL